MTSHTPQPQAGDDLVARLREGVVYLGSIEGDVETYDIDSANELMLKAAEALTSQQHTEPVAGEVERYSLNIPTAQMQVDKNGLFVLASAYDALAAAKDREIEGWRAACMEARVGCNQRSDTIRSLRSHLEAAERQRDALREALDRSRIAIDDWLNTYASDHCSETRVKEAWERIMENGGTLAYIADVQQQNRAALKEEGK